MKRILFVALVSLLCGQLNGSLVYTQPHNGSASLYQSAINGTDYDQMTWDMFLIANSAASRGRKEAAPARTAGSPSRR